MHYYKKVSVIIPAYNEQRTIENVIKRSQDAEVLGLDKEIIIVDNYSTDSTRDILKKFENVPNIKIILHASNEGIGKSWRDGITAATGDIFLRQDADAEYQPEDFPVLLEPIINNKASIVFGSRNMNIEKSKYKYKTYLWGGLLINGMFNVILGTRLTDTLTASKVFTREVLEHISLTSAHFEIEAELTAKATRAGFKILEVPITYNARSFQEGKKIRWHHAFRILSALLKYRFAPLQ